MTPQELDRLEALARAATPGPWLAARWEGRETIVQPDLTATTRGGAWCIADLDRENNRNDAAFIAAANPSTVLRLIAECRRKM